jgi:hypothetical protein
MECKKCTKKATQKRTLNDEGLCQECAIKDKHAKNQADAEERELSVLNELSEEQAAVGTQPFWQNMKKLLDVKFDNFEKKIEQNIKTAVMEDVKKMIEPLEKEIKDLKKENKSLKLDITTLKAKDKENFDKNKKVEDIVKQHQITLSRSEKESRMKRLLVGGMTEEEPLIIDEISYENDDSKVEAMLRVMEVNEVPLMNIKRIGNKDRGNDKRPRFIMIEFNNFNERNKVKRASEKLKQNENTTQLRIKADSSKKERAEYTRLYGIKKKILEEDPGKIVEIKNGKLYVNDEVMDEVAKENNSFL